MAVVQISRIQVRRGQKNQGTGLPQLSSGEMGWAIDTQELYIGNGSVAEGAPQIGNTKIITEHDDLFTLANDYVYKSGDGSVITGIDSTNPVKRNLQERLDDIVSVKAFGITGIQSQNATVPLQRAIDQLYLNAGNISNASNRVVLHLEPGIYTITDTIKIPPYATLVGAGSDKTIIRQTGVGRSVFRTVSDESISGGYIDSQEFNRQSRNIYIEGMTLEVVSGSKGLVLNSCRDSEFKDIKIKGNFELGNLIDADTTNTFNIALEINSFSNLVASKDNKFTRVAIVNFAYAVVSNWDILNNTFEDCSFKNLGKGIVFGNDMIPGTAATAVGTGPANNTITNCLFEDIYEQAIIIARGKYNISNNNKYLRCANRGGGDSLPYSSIIEVGEHGNKSVDDFFSRTEQLSYTEINIEGAEKVVYVPEVKGPCDFVWGFEYEVDVEDGDNITLFRLPQATNQCFDIDYTAQAVQGYNGIRSGKMRILVNSITDIANQTPDVSVSDDYDYVGDNVFLDTLKIDAILRDEDADSNLDTIVLKSFGSGLPSSAVTRFKFKVTTKQTAI